MIIELPAPEIQFSNVTIKIIHLMRDKEKRPAKHENVYFQIDWIFPEYFI